MKKNIGKAGILLAVIALQGDFEDESQLFRKNAVIRPIIPIVETPLNSLMPDSHLESVKFYSQKSHDSNEKILRHGLLKLKKDAPATVLVCHGYMCDKTDVGIFRTIFKDYNVLTFDFRAHGQEKDGQYSSLGHDEIFDVIGAVEYLRSRPELATKPLIAYAFSMGAVSAIGAQSKHGSLFDGMILDCPFDHTDTVLQKGIEQLKFTIFGHEVALPGRTILQKYAYNHYVQKFVKAVFKAITPLDATKIKTRIMPVAPVESIENVNVPCYFITCKNDEKVPVDSVVSVYMGAKGFKRLWITNGRRHYDSFFSNPEHYVFRVNEFVDQVSHGQLKHDQSGYIFQDKDV